MFAMNLDEAKAITVDLGLTPNRSNVRRIVKAHDLVNRNHVRLQADFGDEQIYMVLSQNNPGEVYTVLRNGDVKCTCPDAQKNDVSQCKHSLSVILTEEQDREDTMIAEYEVYDSNRFACDGYELY